MLLQISEIKLSSFSAGATVYLPQGFYTISSQQAIDNPMAAIIQESHFKQVNIFTPAAAIIIKNAPAVIQLVITEGNSTGQVVLASPDLLVPRPFETFAEGALVKKLDLYDEFYLEEAIYRVIDPKHVSASLLDEAAEEGARVCFLVAGKAPVLRKVPLDFKVMKVTPGTLIYTKP